MEIKNITTLEKPEEIRQFYKEYIEENKNEGIRDPDFIADITIGYQLAESHSSPETIEKWLETVPSIQHPSLDVYLKNYFSELDFDKYPAIKKYLSIPHLTLDEQEYGPGISRGWL